MAGAIRVASAAAESMSPRWKASWYTFVSGLQLASTKLVSGLSVVGSLNTWSFAMIEKKKVSTSEVATIGILILSALCSGVAPSGFAASYTSAGTALSEV